MKLINIVKSAVTVAAAVMLVVAVPAGSAVPSVTGLSLPKAAKADLSGKWDLDVKTDSGPVSAKAELKVASDGKITGSIESAEYGASTISSGSVSDASFSFKFNLNSGGSVVEVGMTGTFDEKTMKGSGSAGDSSFTFTGTRASSAQ